MHAQPTHPRALAYATPLRRSTALVAAVLSLLIASVGLASPPKTTPNQPNPGKSAAPAKAPAPAEAAPRDPGAPLDFIKAVYGKLNTVAQSSQKRAVLHKRIGEQMRQFMDYEALGQRTLGKKTWAGLSEAQRKEFIALLTAMVQKSFVKRFKPGTKVTITYQDKVRMKKDGRAQVRTSIRVKRTSAEVYYSLIVRDGSWRVYDIIVDEVSQLATYKRSFRKILAKEGWKGLVARMKKST